MRLQARWLDRLTEINAGITEYEALQQAVSERSGRREFKTMAAFDKANKPLVVALDQLYAEREGACPVDHPKEPTTAQPAAEIAAQWDKADKLRTAIHPHPSPGRCDLFLDKYKKRPGRLRMFDRNWLGSSHRMA